MIRIVVADAALAHASAISRSIEANVQRHGEAHRARITQEIHRRFPAPRPVGTVHAVVESFACPVGGMNCRNCGDPAYAERCRAAGHCPHCGTRHGVAPDAVVAAHGYAIQV